MDNFEKANLLAKQLMDEFTVNYMDKVFYFCLKKTDNSYEAEDLAADIMLSIVSALSRGTVPMYFSAWVWQIAKNRYSAWAKRRHYDREMLLEDGMEENEIMDGKAGLEEEVMQRESILLLRRELAFISEDYRNIIVAYYLEKRKIAEIAASMGLSEEAVKSKLFRGRKRLKEGMDMAREFGVKSYQPEEVDFVSSGDQTNGLPWSAVQRRIPNNILLEANNNPSTMEELAIELGIALPYIEEEVGLLVDATLLKKVGSRYVTNFFIADKECQFAVRMELEKSAREYGKVLDRMVEDCLPKLREIVIAKNQMPDAELKWWAFFYILNRLMQSVPEWEVFQPPKRENGDRWGIAGYEKSEFREERQISWEKCSINGVSFGWIRIDEYGLGKLTGGMGAFEAFFLADVVTQGKRIRDFSEYDKKMWGQIKSCFAHEGENGSVVLAIPLIDAAKEEMISKLLQEHPIFGFLSGKLQETYQGIKDILKKRANPILQEELSYYASMELCDIRMILMHKEVEEGGLVLPEDPKHSTIGMWLEIS